MNNRKWLAFADIMAKIVMPAIICCASISCSDVSCADVSAQQDFLSQQKQCARVKTAFEEKEQIIEENLNKKGFATDNLHILIAAYKAEKQFQGNLSLRCLCPQ